MAIGGWSIDLRHVGGELLALLERLRDQEIDVAAFSRDYEVLVHQAGVIVAEGLGLRSSAIAHDREREVAPFVARLLERWGPALDLYSAGTVFAEQAGADFNDRYQDEARRSGNMVFFAVRLLHARACQVAWEVHRLLTGGFADGAMGRWRTLHEIAVVATLLAFQGDNGLAQRYLDHAAVREYDYARWLRENFPDQVIDDEEYESLRAARDSAVAKYGERHFESDYGWAAPVVGKTKPNLRDLEAVAELSRWRPAYRVANRSVHADSVSARDAMVRRGDDLVLLSGPVNIGLSEPGGNALASLTIVTSAFVLGCDAPPEPLDAINIAGLSGLAEQAVTVFNRIETDIAQEEQAVAERGVVDSQ